MNSDDSAPRTGEPVELPIDGVLDLHTFQAKDVKVVVSEYLTACQEKGILHIRIIHGKGIGNLRRSVHAILSKHPRVASYSLAGEHYGGWGATIVQLASQRRKSDAPECGGEP